MTFIKKIFSITFLLVISLYVYAQKKNNDVPLRIEFQVKENEKPLEAINCKEYGSIVLFAYASPSEDTLFWSFHQLDVNLDVVRDVQIPLPGDIYYKKSSIEDSIAYIAFASDSKKSNVKIVVVKYNLMSAKYSYMVDNSSDYEKLSLINTLNNTVLVSYRTKKNTAKVDILDFNTGKIKELVSANENDESFNRFDILNISKDYYDKNLIIITIKHLTKGNNQILTIYNCNNQHLSTLFEKNLNDSIMPITAATMFSKTGKIISIIGGYFSGDIKKMRSETNLGVKSSGIYTYNLDNDIIREYKINQNNNDIYFIWKDPIKFDSLKNYSTEGYIFRGEAFVPVYSTVSDVDYDYWGRPYTTQTVVLDGYSTFRAMNYIFNASGNMLSISYIDVNNTMSSKPMERVSTFIDDSNEIVNIMFSNDHIEYYISKIESKKTTTDDYYIASKYKKDVVVGERDSKIEPWYDNYYLLNGYQTIKNNSLIGQNKRYIYFMQKIGISN